MSTAKPDFKEIAKQTVQGFNERFNTARADLNEVVADVRDALSDLAPIRFMFFLRVLKNNSDGVDYELVAARERHDEAEHDEVQVCQYHIGVSGYPIIAYYGKNSKESRGALKLKDKGEVIEHFKDMVENGNSPLMSFFLYQMREQEVA